MSQPSLQSLPFGTWPSPVTTDLMVAGAVGISDVIPQPQSTWWCESRPDEGGRAVIRRQADGETTDVTAENVNVRTLVHEYGGGSWWVDNEVCYYVNYADQRLYRQQPGKEAIVLTPVPPRERAWRYADFRVTADGAWVIAVMETQHVDSEPANSIVAIATDGSETLVPLVNGADFYMSPRLSPNGQSLAWIEWQHPNMPWDDTELHIATLTSSGDKPAISASRRVAGGPGESVVQPEWSPDGRLHFLSDRNDWWHLYCDGSDEIVLSVDGEIGYPPWVFGLSRYAFLSDGSVIAARFNDGVEYLDGYPQFTAFNSLRTCGDSVTFSGASWSQESSIIRDGKVIKPARELPLPSAMLPAPEVLHFATTNNAEAYALYFRPAGVDVAAPTDKKPPLIVLAHGGPTSAARSQLSLGRQFWTSRGFAVVDVNYRGSSGFGRQYRKQLEGQWGIADVDDCVAVANYLVERGDVDASRLIIRGGSAGGYTVLTALAKHDVFTAGANMYGVADLEALADDTHKFESRYLDRLIGPYPESKALYEERSPINHLDGFTAPMIVLQGSEDAIVPPNQSRRIVEALDQKQVPVAYHEFEGEQHGFRQAETIKTALASELGFYGRVFGFAPAGATPELEIRHLPD